MRALPFHAILTALLGAACSAGTGSPAPARCVPARTCTSQGYQCGSFTDTCGGPQTCGACGEGFTCSETGGAPGYCQRTGALPPAGNPDGACQQALPPEALPEDTTHPTTVIGDGTAASCTAARLAAAVAAGGVITFSCGPDPVTIPITATLQLRTDRHTAIDGGNRVTLDGGQAVRILEWNSGNWQVNTNVLTLQHLVLAHGRATPTEQIPTGRPPPCSQGWNDGEGGALFMRDGVLRAVDVTFADNQAALLGPDTGGGALFFTSNDPSNRGTLSIRDAHLHDNQQDNDYWQWMPGISTNAETLAPVNSTIVR